VGKVGGIILACLAGLFLLAMLTAQPHKGYSPLVKQEAQFNAMRAALELYRSELGEYPPSDGNDPLGVAYGGAARLCEALVGRDLKGFHPDSLFRADGKDRTGTRQLYATTSDPNAAGRKGPYLESDRISVRKLSDIYGRGKTGPLDGNLPVICDVFERKRKTGVKTGMPILYYRADLEAFTLHPEDNRAMLALGVPWKPSLKHPLLTDPALLYRKASDHGPVAAPRRYEAYELLSAGQDGLYGTKDDILLAN
jgi:hypothetical protein